MMHCYDCAYTSTTTAFSASVGVDGAGYTSVVAAALGSSGACYLVLLLAVALYSTVQRTQVLRQQLTQWRWSYVLVLVLYSVQYDCRYCSGTYGSTKQQHLKYKLQERRPRCSQKQYRQVNMKNIFDKEHINSHNSDVNNALLYNTLRSVCTTTQVLNIDR